MEKFKKYILMLILCSSISYGAEKDLKEIFFSQQHDEFVTQLQSVISEVKQQNAFHALGLLSIYSLQLLILFQLWNIKDLLKKRY